MNITFDGEHLLIKVEQGVTTLDIQGDIYSVWKQWMQADSNSKFLPALRTTGGDPTVGQKIISPYFFLMNGWKIKPASWDHTLNLMGNLFVDEPETYGSNITVPPDGDYTVTVNMSTTSDASTLLIGSNLTQQDKQDIADLIELQTGQPIKATVELLKKIETGTWLIENDTLQIYDGETLLYQYQLSGELTKNYAKRELIP